MNKQLHVLLPLPFAHGFDYAVPEVMSLSPGDYVRVPFGKKDMVGVVWGNAEGGVDEKKIKPIAEHYAHIPTMPEAMRQFIDWVGWYNIAPRGMVLKMAIPVIEALKLPKRGNVTRGNLGAKGIETNATYHVPRATSSLSTAQSEVAHQLRTRLHAGYSVTLLDGVTGSGKTEVYFDAIDALLKESGQTLVLLPEIALSHQWLSRFEKRFGFTPAVWHSDVTKAEKKRIWNQVASGECKLVVGARSALFLPFKNLQLIVVDEEHDHSYKQEDGVIYQARDMAVARAHIEKIPILLVSATPSLESVVNVEQGKYKLLHLPERHAGAQFPEVRLIDMRSIKMDSGNFISPPLRRALADAVASGHQAMLFLNRRGYAPLVLCRACGFRYQCPSCSSWLVLHRGKKRMECHHCGHRAGIPEKCSSCGADDALVAYGPGVEKLEEEVRNFLPQARVAVMASDSISKPEEAEAIVSEMAKGNIDILIGTQMVAKGHHFPGLSTVGIIDADMGMTGGDLRAAERTYQLLHQLSGRAGRELVPGIVHVQTYAPEHPVMQALLKDDRDAFMQIESEMRQMASMPPFGRLAALIIEGSNEQAVTRAAREIAVAAPQISGVRVLGPAPAPLALLRGKYRYRLLVKAEAKLSLQKILPPWLDSVRIPNPIRLKIDVDPYSFV